MTNLFSTPATREPYRRYLTLWFPLLPTERQKHFCGRQDEPLVLVERAGNALRLTAVSHIAAGLGLSPGLTLADARARIPELIAVEADPEQDNQLLKRLAVWADRFTPLVALDGADGLVLDITGCAALFGGEAALRRDALLRLRNLGFTAKACIAGTPEAASALARFSTVAIVDEGADAAATAGLPIAALGADTETARALKRAGLKTIGDLAVRPSAALTARFGRDLARRLAWTCGHENRRLTPLRPSPRCRADRRFAEPLLHAEALSGVLHDLLQETERELERRCEGGLLFEVSFFRTDGNVRHVGVETGGPSRDSATILKLFAERMAMLADPIDPGFGFDGMRLNVLKTGPLKPAQGDFQNRDAGDRALTSLVDGLIARFGPERVQGFVLRDTHNPERAARRVTATKARMHAAGRKHAFEPGAPPLRPVYLFAPPQLIEVPAAQFPDGPPGRFRWRRLVHDVAAAEGPERIAPEWWRGGETMTRDYYRVEDREGRRFWIYRRGLYGRETNEPAWYLHGLFA